MKAPKYIELKSDYLKSGQITIVTKRGGVKECATLLSNEFIEIGGNIYWCDGRNLWGYLCKDDDKRKLCVVNKEVL